MDKHRQIVSEIKIIDRTGDKKKKHAFRPSMFGDAKATAKRDAGSSSIVSKKKEQGSDESQGDAAQTPSASSQEIPNQELQNAASVDKGDPAKSGKDGLSNSSAGHIPATSGESTSVDNSDGKSLPRRPNDAAKESASQKLSRELVEQPASSSTSSV